MPSTLPEGDPVPADGSLPAAALGTLPTEPLACYVHVPYCRVRCGYCDFNTYTFSELNGSGPASPGDYVAAALAEVGLAADVLGRAAPEMDTVFFGGGTPTLLAADDLTALLGALRNRFGLAAGAEISIEANPDSVTPESLRRLAEGGFNRISFGVQSFVPHVLAALDRTHDPASVPRAVRWAREAGFRSVSLDLIYGAPGETLADWETSLRGAVELEPDHVSAYALIVEEGTALARKVRRGEVAAPEDDDLADKYEAADRALAAAGFEWYEVSNWSRGPQHACRHNLHYWRGANWWGIGPGAHSHVGGVRWWNVKHPAAYAQRLQAGQSPGYAREVLGPAEIAAERIILRARLREGLRHEDLDEAAWSRVGGLVADGLLLARGDVVTLTGRGRLLADAVVRVLLD